VSGVVFRLQITLQSEQITQECPAEKSPRQYGTKLTLTFDRLLSFKRNANAQPLVLSGGDGLADLHRFRQKLALALIEVGLKKFAKSSFTPHMTLLYDPRTIERRAIDPVRWTMTEFVLVDSLRGQTKHVPLARWRLRGEPNG